MGGAVLLVECEYEYKYEYEYEYERGRSSYDDSNEAAF